MHLENQKIKSLDYWRKKNKSTFFLNLILMQKVYYDTNSLILVCYVCIKNYFTKFIYLQSTDITIKTTYNMFAF